MCIYSPFHGTAVNPFIRTWGWGWHHFNSEMGIQSNFVTFIVKLKIKFYVILNTAFSFETQRLILEIIYKHHIHMIISRCKETDKVNLLIASGKKHFVNYLRLFHSRPYWTLLLFILQNKNTKIRQNHEAAGFVNL